MARASSVLPAPGGPIISMLWTTTTCILCDFGWIFQQVLGLWLVNGVFILCLG